jgi:hypothetical protein
MGFRYLLLGRGGKIITENTDDTGEGSFSPRSVLGLAKLPNHESF